METENKNKVYVRLLAAAVFLALCLGSLYCSSKTLTSKASESKLSTFFSEPRDFDVLFMGISHMETGVYPLEMWNSYGFTSFDFGEAGNVLPSDYWLLKLALNYTTPKVVVIDVRKMELEAIELNAYTATVFDAFPLSVDKVAAAVDLFPDSLSRMEFLFPFLKYHSRWKELTENDYRNNDFRLDKGAFHYPKEELRVSFPYEYELLSEDDMLPAGKISEEYLCRMIELCREKNIPVVLTELPYPASDNQQRYANGVRLIADRYGVPFLNLCHEDGLVNFYTDMNDPNAHLNDSGAKKVSAYLGAYLSRNYSLEDHRADAEYSDWKDCFNTYSLYKNDRLREQDALLTYLMLLSDPSYRIMLEINNSYVWEDLRYRSLFNNLGIDETEIKSHTRVIEVNEYDHTADYEASESDFPQKPANYESADVRIAVWDADSGELIDDAAFSFVIGTINTGYRNTMAARIDPEAVMPEPDIS